MIFEIYDYIKTHKVIPFVSEHVMGGLSEEQVASLAYLAHRYKDTDNSVLFTKLIERYPWISFLINAMFLKQNSPNICIIIYKTQNKLTIESDEMNSFLMSIINNKVPLKFVSFWCMQVQQLGLSEENTLCLTKAIVETGKVYNYMERFPDHFFERRYPTGGLSEKLALLIPVMLIAFSRQYNMKIKTPFLVAKSLGFTGGTWSKLLSIPDFSFPLPGEESIFALNKSDISMTVSHEDICPADRGIPLSCCPEAICTTAEPVVVVSERYYADGMF